MALLASRLAAGRRRWPPQSLLLCFIAPAPAWAIACGGGGEIGEVALTHAVVAPAPDGGNASEQDVQSWMFASRESSRFEPDGLLLYFELAIDGANAQVEIDLPADAGRAARVSYSETVDGSERFRSDAAAGVVELARDLDGRLCACTDGRFDLRLRDFGPDGRAETDDDAIRELRDGLYRWSEQPCPRALPPGEIALEAMTEVEVRAVDHCLDQGFVAVTPPEGPEPGRAAARGGAIDAHSTRRTPYVDPYDPHHAHRHEPIVYIEGDGCGSGGRQQQSASGCESERAADDSRATGSAGCEGDDAPDDDDAAGCEGDDAPDGEQDGASGCEGDTSEDDATGCEGDRSGAAPRGDARAELRIAGMPCGPRLRPSLWSGAFQNYLWIAFALWLTSRRACGAL